MHRDQEDDRPSSWSPMTPAVAELADRRIDLADGPHRDGRTRRTRGEAYRGRAHPAAGDPREAGPGLDVDAPRVAGRLLPSLLSSAPAWRSAWRPSSLPAFLSGEPRSAASVQQSPASSSPPTWSIEGRRPTAGRPRRACSDEVTAELEPPLRTYRHRRARPRSIAVRSPRRAARTRGPTAGSGPDQGRSKARVPVLWRGWTLDPPDTPAHEPSSDADTAVIAAELSGRACVSRSGDRRSHGRSSDLHHRRHRPLESPIRVVVGFTFLIATACVPQSRAGLDRARLSSSVGSRVQSTIALDQAAMARSSEAELVDPEGPRRPRGAPPRTPPTCALRAPTADAQPRDPPRPSHASTASSAWSLS